MSIRVNNSLKIGFVATVIAFLLTGSVSADDYPRTYEIRYGVKQKKTDPFSKDNLNRRRAEVRAKFLARYPSTVTTESEKSDMDVDRTWTKKIIYGNKIPMRAYERNALKISRPSVALNVNGGFLYYYFESLQFKILRVTVRSKREHDALKVYYALLPSRKFVMADLSTQSVNRWTSKRVK